MPDIRCGGLGGTGLIADDLYLMAHHETSGRHVLQPRALGIGLAGGLLADGEGVALSATAVTTPSTSLIDAIGGLSVGVAFVLHKALEPMMVGAADRVYAKDHVKDISGRMKDIAILTLVSAPRNSRRGERVHDRASPPERGLYIRLCARTRDLDLCGGEAGEGDVRESADVRDRLDKDGADQTAWVHLSLSGERRFTPRQVAGWSNLNQRAVLVVAAVVVIGTAATSAFRAKSEQGDLPVGHAANGLHEAGAWLPDRGEQPRIQRQRAPLRQGLLADSQRHPGKAP